jgi:hypothetical protein
MEIKMYLFCGTSRLRLKCMRRDGHLRDQLSLLEEYEGAEYEACKAVTMDIYYDTFLKELEGGVKRHRPELPTAPAYVIRERHLLRLERVYYTVYPEARERIAEASFARVRELADKRRCDRKLPKSANGPVILTFKNEPLERLAYGDALDDDDEPVIVDSGGEQFFIPAGATMDEVGAVLVDTADVPLDRLCPEFYCDEISYRLQE